MTLARVWRWTKIWSWGGGSKRRGVQCGHLDEIAENIVVPHLERLDAGRLGIGGLEAGDHLTAAVAKRAVLVEIGIIAVADEAAVAGVERKACRRARQKAM